MGEKNKRKRKDGRKKQEKKTKMGEKNKRKKNKPLSPKRENTIKTARALAQLGCENPYARTWMVMLP